MGIHYGNGFGLVYDKELDKPIAKVNYSLIETDATKYTRKRWWGEFSTAKVIKRTGKYVIEMEDGRKGDCVVYTNSEAQQGQGSQYFYHFNGRSALRRK
ncbi:MAG: hypothetical protein KAI14_03310 [Dehalococcoidales bacterium]|nr:hypothetical protein [Dehalococcoidales bacterium]